MRSTSPEGKSFAGAEFEDAVHATRPVHSLDSLAALTVGDLEQVYRGGWVPDSLTALDGNLTGRLLAVDGPLGLRGPAALLRRVAGTRLFPWAGKSFSATSDDSGVGINRLRLLGRRDLFPFEMRIEASAVDGDPAIFLDYDRPDNPWLIRRIHDELRQVADGLFMGPAMWKTRNRPITMLYFACAADQ